MPINFKPVIPGKLYRSGRVAPTELNYLSKLGIDKIIGLDQNNITEIKKYMPNNIRLIERPILLGSNTATMANNIRINFRKIIESNNGVLVNCHAGKDRTGFFIALYRCIIEGKTCDQAIAEAISQGYGTGINANDLAILTNEICKACKAPHKHYNQREKEEKTNIEQISDNEIVIDNNSANDATSEIRQTSEPQNNLFAEATPPAYYPQQDMRSIMLDPTRQGMPYGFVDKIAKMAELYKKASEENCSECKCIECRCDNICEDCNCKECECDMFEDEFEDLNDSSTFVNVGGMDNYEGINGAGNFTGPPSGSPGAPNAASPSQMGGFVQM